jgi:hypothetical protein
MHGAPSSKESRAAAGPETSRVPRWGFTETRPDALRGRQRIEASPGEERAPAVRSAEVRRRPMHRQVPSKAVACALRWDRPMSQTSNAQPASVRHTDANWARLCRWMPGPAAF